MAENRTCAQCGKKAIGFQSIGCGFMDVCEEHADSHVLPLNPAKSNRLTKIVSSNGLLHLVADPFLWLFNMEQAHC